MVGVTSQALVLSINDATTETEESSSHFTESMVESEGERSFSYDNDNSHRRSIVEDKEVRELCASLANSALKDFIDRFFRESTTRTPGSSVSSSSRRGQQTPEASSASSSSGENRSSTKRSFQSRRLLGDLDEDEEDGSYKKQCRSSPDKAATNRLFACPYYRFDINRYSERNIDEVCYRGCSSACLRDLSRLKQHLYRVHRRPDYYCGSCYDVFKTQDMLDAHTRARPACENSQPLFQEKMDKDQMNLIKRRNMGALPQSEWLNIYKILFPGAHPPPPSFAYADGNSSEAVEEFVAYFETEGPQMLSSLIHSHLEGRIFFADEMQNVLDEAFEYGTSRLVSLLRPRLDRLGLLRPSREAATLAIYTADLDVNEVNTNTNTSMQQLPALEDTLYLDDLEVDFVQEQWFNHEYMD
jgi:hypothetical protein